MAAAFMLSSALGLLQLALVSRWLTDAQYAQFLGLWGLVFAFGSVIGAMEQEVARQATESTLAGSGVPRSALQAVGVTAVGTCAVLLLLLSSGPGRALTAHSAPVVLLVLSSIAGFAGLILTRGVLLGTHHVRLYVGVLAGEGVLRILLVLAVIGGGTAGSLPWAVAGIVIGCFSWVPVVAHLVRSVDWHSALVPWRRTASTVAALAIANGLTAIVLTGFPTVASLAIGDTRSLGDLFAVMTISRVPIILLIPVQALTVPIVVRWVRTGETARLSTAISWVGAATLVVTALATAAGYYAGPWATRLLMGDQYSPMPWTCAVVLAATCMLGSALVQASAIVALGRFWLLTSAWALAVTAALLVMSLLPYSAEVRGTAGFATAAVAAVLAIGTILRSRRWIAAPLPVSTHR